MFGTRSDQPSYLCKAAKVARSHATEKRPEVMEGSVG